MAVAEVVKKEHQCPKCKSELNRIPRNFIFKKVLPFIPVKHYICYRCKRKFYRIGS